MSALEEGLRVLSNLRAKGLLPFSQQGPLTLGGEAGIAPSSLPEKSLRLCAEMLDGDNLVLPSALLLL